MGANFSPFLEMFVFINYNPRARDGRDSSTTVISVPTFPFQSTRP